MVTSFFLYFFFLAFLFQSGFQTVLQSFMPKIVWMTFWSIPSTINEKALRFFLFCTPFPFARKVLVTNSMHPHKTDQLWLMHIQPSCMCLFNIDWKFGDWAWSRILDSLKESWQQGFCSFEWCAYRQDRMCRRKDYSSHFITQTL